VDDLGNFLLLLGQFFQIRDDYINLTSAKVRASLWFWSQHYSDTSQYEKEKGFAEDLDEGKLSLPMIHLLNSSKDRLMIEHILQQRSRDGSMPPEMKMLVLQKMNEAGSLEFTRETLASVETEAREALSLLEQQSKFPNYILQYLLVSLSDVRK
jgi:ophiobolin F synthase